MGRKRHRERGVWFATWARRVKESGKGKPLAGPAPRPDRTLRVEIGGGAPAVAKPPAAPPKGDAPHVTNDVPPPNPAPTAPPPASERTYTVKSGDTLSDIAKRELGATSRAQEIADLNGVTDPTRLKAGQVLKLPAK